MANPVNIFIAYAPNDNSYFEALRNHLAVLERNTNVHIWYEGRTVIGENKAETLSRELEQADFILLLVSADMVASDFYQNTLLPNLQRFQQDKGVKVIPIVIREAIWDEDLFDRKCILPKEGVWSDDIGYWKNPDKFYVHVATKLIEWIDTELVARGLKSEKRNETPQKPKTKYKQGKVLYLIPENMELLKRHACYIRISPEEISLEELKKGLKNINDAVIEDIRIDSIMKAEIIDDTNGEFFDIDQIGELEQPIEDDSYTEWRYNITPLKEGVHSLVLKISVMVRIAELDKLVYKDVVVLDRAIKVSTFAVEQQKSWQFAANQIIPFGAMTAMKDAGEEGETGGRKLSRIILPILLAVIALPAFAMFALTNLTTSIYLKLAYDEHRTLQDERIAVKKDGKWGFVNKYGVESTEPKYDKVGDFSNGMVMAMNKGEETQIARMTNQSFWQAFWNPIDYPITENPCKDKQCGVNGECVNGVCQCKNGYSGSNCEIPPAPSDPCLKINCGANGKCVNGICVCNTGYTGDRCQTVIAANDPCKKINCGINGTCVKGICKCKDGYTGNRCQTALAPPDKCKDINCGANGTCLNGKCECKNGYTGNRCQTPPKATDICAELRCSENGTCNPVTKVCDCKPGYSGKRCQLKSGLCNDVNCGNNGKCNPETGKCDCKNGYTGDNCQTPPELCKDIDCGNYGKCNTKTGKCDCKNGYTGERCQTPPDKCKLMKCGANGTCNPQTGLCDCINGYTGIFCQNPPDLCKGNKCSGHGKCDTKTGMCKCDDGYYGDKCQHETIK